MTLEQCTKEELIFIINKLAGYGSFNEDQKQNKIGRHLADIEFMRAQKTLNEAENWATIAADNRRQYVKLLEPYEGIKLTDIPIEVIKKAESFIKDAQYADKKWDECMRKVDKKWAKAK